jgi:hypothetical protein
MAGKDDGVKWLGRLRAAGLLLAEEFEGAVELAVKAGFIAREKVMAGGDAFLVGEGVQRAPRDGIPIALRPSHVPVHRKFL